MQILRNFNYIYLPADLLKKYPPPPPPIFFFFLQPLLGVILRNCEHLLLSLSCFEKWAKPSLLQLVLLFSLKLRNFKCAPIVLPSWLRNIQKKTRHCSFCSAGISSANASCSCCRAWNEWFLSIVNFVQSQWMDGLHLKSNNGWPLFMYSQWRDGLYSNSKSINEWPLFKVKQCMIYSQSRPWTAWPFFLSQWTDGVCS